MKLLEEMATFKVISKVSMELWVGNRLKINFKMKVTLNKLNLIITSPIIPFDLWINYLKDKILCMLIFLKMNKKDIEHQKNESRELIWINLTNLLRLELILIIDMFLEIWKINFLMIRF